MSMNAPPLEKPINPCFSSGPCAKRPGWTIAALSDALVGRSHRSKEAMVKIQEVITRCRNILQIPDDYVIGITPASDTGAVEMALWSMLGPRPVDVLSWEAFGKDWLTDITKQLKLPQVNAYDVDYGQMPDLTQVNSDHDIVFCWNGTTSGVYVQDASWISTDRQGLVFCDAISAAFAVPLDWDKLDVTTFSWQKSLGSEAQHGMLVLSPRALQRLQEYTPNIPLPKIFRLMKKGEVSMGFFKGETINTPSMLAVEDALDALRWCEQVGGLTELCQRTERNFHEIEKWLGENPDFAFLATDAKYRSPISVCFKIINPKVTGLGEEQHRTFVKNICDRVESHGGGYDIRNHMLAPPAFRLWCGPTVEAEDVKRCLAWIKWSYAEQLGSAQ